MPGERRVGILGGTFDPPHIGHLATAVEVRHRMELDEVLLVVANDPWQKSGQRPVTPAADRLAMVRAAVEGLDGVQASALEIERGGPSYTIDTLEQLDAAAPGGRWYVVVGADAAAGLPTWHRAEDLRGVARLVVVDRPGLASAALPDGWTVDHVTVPRLDVSSSDLRRRAAEGRPLDVLVPPGVITCIRDRRLYGWHRP